MKQNLYPFGVLVYTFRVIFVIVIIVLFGLFYFGLEKKDTLKETRECNEYAISQGYESGTLVIDDHLLIYAVGFGYDIRYCRGFSEPITVSNLYNLNRKYWINWGDTIW